MTPYIFVEGKADVKFIRDFVEYRFNQKLEIGIDIIDSGGWDGLPKLQNVFLENTDNGRSNLVIFDTDTDYSTRVEELTKYKEELNIKFDLFLLPNNEDSGDLETLLEKIINQENKDIFDCFDSYEDCLRSKDKGYTTPARKTKIYSYLEALLGSTNAEKRKISLDKREYTNKDHWDLDNASLNPLFEFLSPFFQ